MSRAEQIEPDALRRLYDRIDHLEREVRELRAARRLESAAIGAGGLTIRDGGGIHVVDAEGRTVAMIGDLSSIGDGWRGVWVNRPGGHPALRVYGTGVGSDYGFVGIYDVSGNYIVTDDAASGRGLARPYIPIQMGEVAVPSQTTTSSSFTELYRGANVLQHPALYVYLLVRASDSSTTGEVRLAIDGAPVGPVLPVTAGSYAFAGLGPVAVPGHGVHEQLHQVAIQARRTGGSGTIGVRVLSAIGLESAWL